MARCRWRRGATRRVRAGRSLRDGLLGFWLLLLLFVVYPLG